MTRSPPSEPRIGRQLAGIGWEVVAEDRAVLDGRNHGLQCVGVIGVWLVAQAGGQVAKWGGG